MICLVPSLFVSMDMVVSFVMPVSVVSVDSVDVTGSVDPVIFSSSVAVATKLSRNLLCGLHFSKPSSRIDDWIFYIYILIRRYHELIVFDIIK